MVRPAHLVFAIALASCTHAGRGGPATSDNVISQQEIEQSAAITAYDAVQRLRGTFLSDRGKTTLIGSSPNRPTVFLDGVRYGEIQSLRNIAASQIASIRLYRAWEAQQKFGAGHLAGVIEVITRSQ